MTLKIGDEIKLSAHKDLIAWAVGLKGRVVGKDRDAISAQITIPPGLVDIARRSGWNMLTNGATGGHYITFTLTPDWYVRVKQLTLEDKQLRDELKSKVNRSPVEDYILSELED